jgi:hypothetical protein
MDLNRGEIGLSKREIDVDKSNLGLDKGKIDLDKSKLGLDKGKIDPTRQAKRLFPNNFSIDKTFWRPVHSAYLNVADSLLDCFAAMSW